MALRRQIPEARATYRDPVFGVNLFAAEQDLREGQARLMQNATYEGGTRMRTGNRRITATTLDGARRIRGGAKFYFGGNQLLSQRLVAYGTRISRIADNGTEIIVNSGMTDDRDTHFNAWPITDQMYISNGVDTLRQYDGTTFATVTGTNVPAPIFGSVQPILDRLMCITGNGIERTDPRSATVWSSNSSWATLRPIHSGVFQALKSFSLRGTDSIFDGLVALQASAHYLITGTDFGGDVTAVSPPAGEDSRIQLLNPNVGTRSPYSVTVVPGVGMFWFTNDRNVYWLPEQTINRGRFVGDNIRSNGTTPGIESANLAALDQVWMEYLHPYLMLGIPLGSDTFATTQWWLDIRSLQENPERGPVWYGPMIGQSVGRIWAETQVNDNSVFAGEGNAAVGAFVYQARRTDDVFSDAIGTVDTNFTLSYQTNFKDFGAPSRQKYVRGVHLDLNDFSGTATIDLLDLPGVVESGIAITTI